MCGIAGLWFQSSVAEDLLLNYGTIMANKLINRGPDNEGFWQNSNNGILFAHRRLAIRDLNDSGSQPMFSQDKNLVIVFNGEIYNYQSLKNELKDYKWEGTSDTEVLIASIQKWGLKVALQKCYGMFAFALWNLKDKKLILARDRFGEKPLYWGRLNLENQSKSIIAFSSDLSSFWSIPKVKKEIEYSSFSDFLKYGYVRNPLSIQKGIFQLNPGSYVEIESNNGFAPRELPNPISWWDIRKISYNYFNIQSDENNIKIVEETLKNLLKQQKDADVPTASFLSGGIDSSLIAALLQNQSNKRIKTFNISFPEDGNGEELFDEGPFAKNVANYLNTDHYEIPVSSKNIQELIPNISKIYSEPFADSSQLATCLICKEITNFDIKVALTGDGADELFGGYNRHKLIPLIHKRFKNFPTIIKHSLGNVIKLFPSNNQDLSQEKARKLIDSIKKSSNLEEIYDSVLSNNSNVRLFHNNEEKENSNLITFNNILAPTYTEKIMIADCISYLPNNILVKLDRASMEYGLETRSPFLDERIAILAWSIKLKNKLYGNNNNFESKSILKRILYKYVPKEYFKRPKTGFSLPISSWLRGPLKEWAGDLLNCDLIEKQGFLSSNNIKDIWESHLNGNSENTELIWTILMWQSWMEKWS